MDEMGKIHKPLFPDCTYQAKLDELQQQIAKAEAAVGLYTRSPVITFLKHEQGTIPMLKDHCCFILRAEEVSKILAKTRDTATKPNIIDKMLDLPEEKRANVLQTPYNDTTVSVPNLTILPDRMMASFAPVFMVRHPVKQVESWYRASRVFGVQPNEPDFELVASYAASRKIYDYYEDLYHGRKDNGHANEHSDGIGHGDEENVWPIIIDGDDLVNDPEGMSKKFCKVVGLDPAGLIFLWEVKEFTKGPTEVAFEGTLVKSEGVKKNLVGGPEHCWL